MCGKISRTNPKRPQLLKTGFVLETHRHPLFGSGVQQKGQFTWSRVAFTNLLRMLAWIRSLLHLFSHSQPIATGDFVERAVNWMRVDGKLGGRGPALCFCGGLGVDKPRSLGGLTPVRNKSETQCYHDPRRPGLAVRMFVRPFVWAACAQHIHVNLRPGCFQISRANPKRPQLLKKVLETHWRLFGSCVRQKCGGSVWTSLGHLLGLTPV